MRNSRKRLTLNQQGKILVLVLVLLVVGGLLLTPLLGLMSTGLISGQVYERKAAELYAADAGVEDAIWRIKYPDVAGLPSIVCDDRWDDEFPLYYIDVNGRNVEVLIEYLGSDAYRITSTARSNGSDTRIEAHIGVTIKYLSYSGMMDHIITINEKLTAKELDALAREIAKVTLDCRAECLDEDTGCPDGCGGIYDYAFIPEGCYGCGVVYNFSEALWPKPGFLADWYWNEVKSETPYAYDRIDLDGADLELGPLYRDGTLNIYNSRNVPAALNLTGTFYITGDTSIGTEKHDFTLNLNGYTIFVESDSTGSGKEALKIGGQVTINGPGAIIAIGDIYFAPNGDVGGNEQGVFIMSVSGQTTLQPSGDFFGSVAGNWYVEVKSGQGPILTYPPGGMGDLYDFPSLVEVDRECNIVSWEIK